MGPDQKLQMLTRRFSLTTDQQAKIKPILYWKVRASRCRPSPGIHRSRAKTV